MKKKVIKFISKFLSVFLSALFVAEILPTQIIAEAYNDWSNSKSYVNELIENPTANKESTSDILYEVTEKRDEYTKVYKKSDGSYTALVSKTPIHFLSEGLWQEINNSLTPENGIFTNISNTFNVLFPNAISDDEQITVESDGSQIAFSVNDIDSSIGNIENSIGEFDVNIEIAENALANTQSSITYKNACNGTDIQYTVLPNAIKENIIVSSKENLKSSYSFIFEIGELNYTLHEDGSISFNDGDKIKFTIPRPVMTDANYSLSYDIDTAVSNNNDGTITLTYTPSTVWTSSRARVYPINIDPAIIMSDESYSETAFVISDEPTENFYNTSTAIISNGKILDEETNEIVPENIYSEIYIKFDIDSIKCLTESVTPTNVQLVTLGGGKNIAAYEIMSSCNFQTVTYNEKPVKAATPVDFYTGKDDYNEAELIHFDITELFDNWLNGRKTNLGIALAGYNDSIPGMALLFTREPYGATYLIIDYVETSGYNDAYSYQQNDIMRAGTSYINNFSRQLFIKRDDISIPGNIMPVELSFMYNTTIFQQQEAVSPYGNNWLTNYNRLIYTFEDGIGRPYLCYADENGSIKYFFITEDEEGKLVFTDEFEDIYGNSGIQVIYNPSENEGDILLSDIQISNNGYTESFDDLGRLVRITNKHSKYIEITYSDASDLYKISKITDGVGKEYRFTYKNGRLSNIQCYNAQGTAIYAGSSTSTYLKNDYSYDKNGNLEKVNYPDESNAHYTYNNNNRLISASNRELYKLLYSYTSYNRVSSVTEYARETTLSSYTKGNSIGYASFGPRFVKIYDSYGRQEDIQFDKCGLVSQIIDEKGNVYNADTGSLVSSSQNLLLNTSFEDSLTAWDVDEEYTSVSDTGNAYHGNKSLEFNQSKSENGEYDSPYVSQSVDVNGGGAYTFSAYVDAAQTDSDSNLMMTITAYDENDDELTSNLRLISSVKNGYQRHSLVVNTPDDTRRIEVAIGLFESYGTFNIDAVQLENQSGASNYNMLENGSFTQGDLNWDINKPFDINVADIHNKSRNKVSFEKAYNADIKMSQTVTVNAKKGDIVTLGGWINSNTVSNDGNNTLGIFLPDTTNFLGDRFAGLVITYQYFSKDENGQNVLNTVVEKKAIHDYIVGWQYLENQIVMLADVETVTVSFEFKNHKSGVDLFDLCLSKDHIEYDYSSEEADGETDITDEEFVNAESFGSSVTA
ncbi:MAG: DNRLRE domain-containing protein, partial [Ruminococcus sp.]|nr:DNRLRE domain-containing protein [Ruminococcus sp.]